MVSTSHSPSPLRPATSQSFLHSPLDLQSIRSQTSLSRLHCPLPASSIRHPESTINKTPSIEFAFSKPRAFLHIPLASKAFLQQLLLLARPASASSPPWRRTQDRGPPKPLHLLVCYPARVISQRPQAINPRQRSVYLETHSSESAFIRHRYVSLIIFISPSSPVPKVVGPSNPPNTRLLP